MPWKAEPKMSTPETYSRALRPGRRPAANGPCAHSGGVSEPPNELCALQLLFASAQGARSDSHPHEPMPRHPPDQPFELEHAERGHDLAGGHAGAGDQVVDGGRMIVQVAQERSFQVGECQLGRMTDRWFLGSRCEPLEPADRALRECRRPSRPGGHRRGSSDGSPGWPCCRPGRVRRRPRDSVPWRATRSRATRCAGLLRRPAHPATARK